MHCYFIDIHVGSAHADGQVEEDDNFHTCLSRKTYFSDWHYKLGKTWLEAAGIPLGRGFNWECALGIPEFEEVQLLKPQQVFGT